MPSRQINSAPRIVARLNCGELNRETSDILELTYSKIEAEGRAMRGRFLGVTGLVLVPFFVSSCAFGGDGGESASPAPTVTETVTASPEPVTETVTATPEPEELEDFFGLDVEDFDLEDLFTDEELQELAEFYSGEEIPEWDEQFAEDEIDVPDSSSTDRGNRPMPNTVTLSDTVTNEPYVELEAGEVNTDVQCTGPRPSPPENGHFISVNFKVSVESSFRDIRPDGFRLTAHHFDVLDADGHMSNARVASTATYGCLADSELLPDETLPGTTSEGAVLLDSNVESGFLIYHERNSGDSYEWEF